MIKHNASHGSAEWIESRRGIITASRFKDARARLKNGGWSEKAISYAHDLARERVGGAAPSNFVSSAMRFGLEQESLAIMSFEAKTGHFVETDCGFISTDDRVFGCTPDGLIGDNAAVEVKTIVSSQTLFRVIGGDISDYIDQCLGYLMLLDIELVYLVFWIPDMPEELKMMTSVIRRTDYLDQIRELRADLIEFDKLVNEKKNLLADVVGLMQS